jgi:ATP-binding cassette subfamily B protein
MTVSIGGRDSALRCLVEVARRRGIETSVERIRHDQLLESGELSPQLLASAAEKIGLRARVMRAKWKHVVELDQAFPVIARLRNGNSVILTGLSEVGGATVVMMRDPLAQADEPMPLDEARFCGAWTGELVLLKPDRGHKEEEAKFGLSWFFPILFQHGNIFRDIAVSAIMLSVLGMAMPVFIQIIIDRVLVHRSISTLNMLIVGMVLSIVFETLFSYLRRYLMLYVTQKIDAEVGVRTFAKMISLPMDFFEKAPTGVITKNMLQTERIRQFLAGQLFSVLLDAIGLIVFIPMMFLYSVPLAVIVMLSTALLAILMAALIPPLKKRMNNLYQAEADLQSFLIENVQGMRTVKSLALDARQRGVWDRLLARALDCRFDLANFAAIAGTLVSPIDKVAQMGVMALGAYLVFDGEIMVGALIAFRIVSARVTAPLVALSQMTQQFQEVALSVQMLGQIMNHPSEEGRNGRGLRAKIEGKVEFENIRFTYPGASTPALDNISLTIPAGSMFGIMGRSGSGKTTVTRLLQALHRPDRGLIKIDGHDLREIDLDHLRTNIGVVLQENFLFRGSIRENIASGKPGATFEEVVEAARLAGADEFIERLPRGYDTLLEEGSSNLSGGQRQRIAIARALIIDPPILILDEATSALDAESEMVVHSNLMNIARGRTLITISHRLSSLVGSDQIMVMDQGKVADIGQHQELLNRCDVYRHLWYKQNRHLGLAS